MDFNECLNKKIIKNVKVDNNLIISARKIAKLKIESAEFLPEHLFIGKITLLYDGLRGYLECIALEKGYKVYNHECYSSFLNEIMHLPNEAELFNKLRKIRNGINYYGETVDLEKADYIIDKLIYLIDRFKK